MHVNGSVFIHFARAASTLQRQLHEQRSDCPCLITAGCSWAGVNGLLLLLT
jgi:hypothetical protein